ncbi:MAG: rRNA maturation RNase YbeY [Pirellulales bacterium]
MISIEISNQQDALRFDEARLKRGALAVLRDAGVADGSLSIAVVDDPTIHALNQKYLAHDYPTDVLSFALAQDAGRLEGEVVASAETAARAAQQFGWSAEDELLLYVVHGTLHLVGYDDVSDELRMTMRAAERRYLADFGLELREEPREGDDRLAEK